MSLGALALFLLGRVKMLTVGYECNKLVNVSVPAQEMFIFVRKKIQKHKKKSTSAHLFIRNSHVLSV